MSLDRIFIAKGLSMKYVTLRCVCVGGGPCKRYGSTTVGFQSINFVL